MTLYVGSDDKKAHKVKKAYIGVDGIGRKMKAMYVGDENGIARKVFPDGLGGVLFTSPNPFSLKLTSYDLDKWTTPAKIYKSKDEINWEETDGQQMDAYSDNANGYLLYVRTDDYLNSDDYAIYMTEYADYYFSTINGNDISISGDIMNLCGNKPMRPACFIALFEDMAALTSCKNLKFPKQTAEYCYYDLFWRTGIKDTPSILNFENAAAYSCAYMFQKCQSLIEVELDLPSLHMYPNCYMKMFDNCHSLKKAKVTISKSNGIMYEDEVYGKYHRANQCQSMFANCENMIEGPDILPCMNLAYDCYYCMFECAEKLLEPPILPATKMASCCYYEMFECCYALTRCPELPATELDYACYEMMFESCYSIINPPPELPANYSGSQPLPAFCYNFMFEGCRKMRTAPALPSLNLGGDVGELYDYQCQYGGMFADCRSLEEPPELPATKLSPYCYDHMFVNCRRLKRCPNLPATELYESCYQSMFEYCYAITALANMPISFPSLPERCMCNMYHDCMAIPWIVGTDNTFIINTTGEVGVKAIENMFATNNGDFPQDPNSTYEGTPALNISYTYKSPVTGTIPEHSEYLCFESELPYRLSMRYGGSDTAWTTTAKISYSLDGSTWYLLNNDTNIEAKTIPMAYYKDSNKYAVWLKTDTYLNDTSSYATYAKRRCQFKTVLPTGLCAPNADVKIQVKGALASIAGNQPIAHNYAQFLFNATHIVNADGLILPSEALPSKTIGYYCYYCMFQNCPMLESANFQMMQSPTLSSYSYMFYGCSKLTTPPQLLFTKLSNNRALYAMFKNCKALTKPANINITDFGNSAQGLIEMFGNCTNIIFTTDTSKTSYRIPQTGTGTNAASDTFDDMFSGCGGTLPGGSGTPLINTTYYVN